MFINICEGENRQGQRKLCRQQNEMIICFGMRFFFFLFNKIKENSRKEEHLKRSEAKDLSAILLLQTKKQAERKRNKNVNIKSTFCLCAHL